MEQCDIPDGLALLDNSFGTPADLAIAARDVRAGGGIKVIDNLVSDINEAASRTLQIVKKVRPRGGTQTLSLVLTNTRLRFSPSRL